jgi:hypothetical protein
MVELINVNKDENQKLTYPSCLRSEGIGPSQYGTKGLINEKLAEIEEKYDINTTILADGYTEEGDEDTEETESNEDVEEENTSE